jgi:hypothetical protein
MQAQWTPLHCAAFYGHVDVVRHLVASGATMDAVTNVTPQIRSLRHALQVVCNAVRAMHTHCITRKMSCNAARLFGFVEGGVRLACEFHHSAYCEHVAATLREH